MPPEASQGLQEAPGLPGASERPGGVPTINLGNFWRASREPSVCPLFVASNQWIEFRLYRLSRESFGALHELEKLSRGFLASRKVLEAGLFMCSTGSLEAF